MKRVTGLGGVFFKTGDQAKTIAWYRDRLGIPVQEWGGHAFLWKEPEAPEKTGYTVWGSFDAGSDYFDPSQQPFMVNFRVHDLPALLETLKKEGVEQVGEMIEEPNGKFAWVLDPEGTKIELWEPVDPDEDPYLK